MALSINFTPCFCWVVRATFVSAFILRFTPVFTAVSITFLCEVTPGGSCRAAVLNKFTIVCQFTVNFRFTADFASWYCVIFTILFISRATVIIESNTDLEIWAPLFIIFAAWSIMFKTNPCVGIFPAAVIARIAATVSNTFI